MIQELFTQTSVSFQKLTISLVITALSSMWQAGFYVHNGFISREAPQGNTFWRHFRRVTFKLKPTPYAVANASNSSEMTIRWTAKFTHAEAGALLRCHNFLLCLSAGKHLHWRNSTYINMNCIHLYMASLIFWGIHCVYIRNLIRLSEYCSTGGTLRHDHGLIYRSPIYTGLDQGIRNF